MKCCVVATSAVANETAATVITGPWAGFFVAVILPISIRAKADMEATRYENQNVWCRNCAACTLATSCSPRLAASASRDLRKNSNIGDGCRFRVVHVWCSAKDGANRNTQDQVSLYSCHENYRDINR